MSNMSMLRKHNPERCSSVVDRLPDDILAHILSFMPTKDCVRSSILGKRWRLLWAHVPNLKLDSGDHKTKRSLIDFFNRFVFVHKGNTINTLSIACDDDKESSEYKSEIETLIGTAIACNVQVIVFQSGFELVLPQCLFTCKTLVDLAIKGKSTKNRYPRELPLTLTGTSAVVNLPALKKLQLSYVRYESEESIVRLLSGCPALEELTIVKGVDKAVCFRVSSPTLTRLDFDMDDESGDYVYPDEDGDDEACNVKLDTPALKYLKLLVPVSQDFSAGTLASLTEADIHYYDTTGNFDQDLYSDPILQFVGELNNVSYLKLSPGWMQFPNSGLTREFRNLTKLEFDGDLGLVASFLENSDNLQVLISTTGYFSVGDWTEPKHMPLCLKYNLGTVRFDEFWCEETEFKMVEYILRNARVLKKMEIFVSVKQDDGVKKKQEALERIALFERASEACQLVFR